MRRAYADANIKVNELLYRRVDVDDVVAAHLLALEKAAAIGFGRYIISATTPLSRQDLAELRVDAPRLVARLVPQYAQTTSAWAGQCFRHRPRSRERSRAA
jgi:UDP-glucose 4-epimerase